MLFAQLQYLTLRRLDIYTIALALCQGVLLKRIGASFCARPRHANLHELRCFAPPRGKLSRAYQPKKRGPSRASFLWCAREDLNLHECNLTST